MSHKPSKLAKNSDQKKSPNKAICRLCGEEKLLRKSHIIPQSYYRRIKSGNGQLLKVKGDKTTPPALDNSDPKDRLLCQDCEQFIEKNYEKEGTQFFKPRSTTIVMPNYIKIKKFKYRIIYLYFLSIIWRASESSLPQYKELTLGNIAPLIRQCLINKSLSISPQVRIDHFIKICVVRITEKSGTISDRLIKKCLIDIALDKGEELSEGFLYYFMIDGFLVCYLFKAVENFELQKTARYLSQLEDRSSIKLQKVDISELSQLSSLFSEVTRKILEAGPPR